MWERPKSASFACRIASGCRLKRNTLGERRSQWTVAGLLLCRAVSAREMSRTIFALRREEYFETKLKGKDAIGKKAGLVYPVELGLNGMQVGIMLCQQSTETVPLLKLGIRVHDLR